MFEQTTPPVKLLLGIRARALSPVRPRPVWLSGARKNVQLASNPKSWKYSHDFLVVQHFLFRSRLNLLLQKNKKPHVTATWNYTFSDCFHVNKTTNIFSPCVYTAAAAALLASTVPDRSRFLPAKPPLQPSRPAVWPTCGADIGTHLHSKSSHLRCASLPTVLFSVVCLSLCLFVRCCI